eukprot:9230992-Pyramimonas_sp.AAC.1
MQLIPVKRILLFSRATSTRAQLAPLPDATVLLQPLVFGELIVIRLVGVTACLFVSLIFGGVSYSRRTRVHRARRAGSPLRAASRARRAS